jgi:hypothetical protein
MASAKSKSGLMPDVFLMACQLLCSQGVPREIVEKRCKQAIDFTYNSRKRRVLGAERISRLADVCARWFLEAEFIDEHGGPRPLHWNGKSGGLIKLVSQVVGRGNAREVISELISRKLIREITLGEWIPKSQVVAPHGFHSAQILRSTSMMTRLLRTIAHNSELRYKGDVLLEVMAQVPRLPSRELRSFRRFTKAQGLSFAKSVDDWLESRNIKRAAHVRRATREAGVIAFAFIEPSSTRRTRKLPSL